MYKSLSLFNCKSSKRIKLRYNVRALELLEISHASNYVKKAGNVELNARMPRRNN